MWWLWMQIHLLWFTGPDQQVIAVNPSDIVSVRAPRKTEHFSKGVRCLIHTLDGKYIAIIEPCNVVFQRLEEAE
jgi:hypothetical protein